VTMRRRFERDALPSGKEPGDPQGCQLGRLSHGKGHVPARYCGGKGVIKIGNVRLCKRHKALLDAIVASPNPQADSTRRPISRVWSGAAVA
jgi:hypothetical protein